MGGQHSNSPRCFPIYSWHWELVDSKILSWRVLAEGLFHKAMWEGRKIAWKTMSEKMAVHIFFNSWKGSRSHYVGISEDIYFGYSVSTFRKTYIILDIIIKVIRNKRVYYCPDSKLMPFYLCYLYNLSFEDYAGKWIKGLNKDYSNKRWVCHL